MKKLLLCIALLVSACLLSHDEYDHRKDDSNLNEMQFPFNDEYGFSFDGISNPNFGNNNFNNNCIGQNGAGMEYHRIGRFSDEDSFDTDCIDDIIASAPVAVKKIIINLLYPPKNKAALPKRLLLVGKPGTGKTTLAKAIAYKCGYDYYVIEAPFLLNEYKNSGPQNLLREVYPLLNSGRPVIIILDELTELTDRYKKENDSDATVGAALWILLDSCAQYDNVFFIGTSNKQKKDLPAQLQSRFDEDIITIYLPNAAARKRILLRHLKHERHKIDDASLHYLIKKTNGRSAREIEKLVFKAIQFANTRIPRRYTVTPADFEKALKLWKPWWHPLIIYQTIEPHLQPFFKTAFPIILQTIGLIHSIYSAERQHKNSDRGLALQEASYLLQEAGQVMQEKAHKESMNHQREVLAHQRSAHNESMEQQRKSFEHQEKAHRESLDQQQKAHDQSAKQQKELHDESIKQQKTAHEETIAQQKEFHDDSSLMQKGLLIGGAILNVIASCLDKIIIACIKAKMRTKK